MSSKRCETISRSSLTLCDGGFIRSLNAQWRGLDKETDVLSFPMEDEGEEMLGDIVICVDVAMRQAAETALEKLDTSDRYAAGGQIVLKESVLR